MTIYSKKTIETLNADIREHFAEVVSPIKFNDKRSKYGVGKLVMLDRYSFKDTEKKTLKESDVVILTVVNDPNFPARGIGQYRGDHNGQALIEIDEEFEKLISENEPRFGTYVLRNYSEFDKPMELFYEQIARRVARGLAAVEDPGSYKEGIEKAIAQEVSDENIVPAGRVLYGAGSDTDVTYFNCYVLPLPQDSREGIQQHRTKAMEIMSRGGGVGTNGSTLRPRGALAKGVNGRSSGSVSWLNDLASLTNLVEQGGSRRGAQMIMLNDWHPDIYEFVISKMQNPDILRLLIRDSKDPEIVRLAQDKLKFTPFTQQEISDMETAARYYDLSDDADNANRIDDKLQEGGHYSVHNSEFMAGANISVNITHEFMEAVKNDGMYDLRFPDVDSYNKKEKAEYNALWHHSGDVREWAKKNRRVKVYRTIRAKDLWNLINTCATYSAEPGIFFIDNANDMTNAKTYGQKVVATNPCGEQPLAPNSVCNLLAINLANMSKDGQLDIEKLHKSVSVATVMGDNVVDATPYFLNENEEMAKGERRIGLGVMGLADLLIDLGIEYGSDESITVIDTIFHAITTRAYKTSIALAEKKGSFPFFNRSFINSGFMLKMPEDIRRDIRVKGIRNSHLITVAPTGSTGTMIGVSTGLEPYFAFKYYRSGRLGKNIEVNAPIVEKYLRDNPGTDPDNLPKQFISTMQISPAAHVKVQVAIQRWVDSSISKTVNAPAGFTVDQVQEVYESLYKGGAKGGTVYVDGSRNAQVLSLSSSDDAKETKKVYIDETVRPLRETNVNYGNEIGDQCPVCRDGKVIDRGGCTECDSCQVQLKCGL